MLQPIARRLLWPAMLRRPAALPSYSRGSKIPAPAPLVRAMAPLAIRGEVRLNHADEGAVRADLRALPGHLDRVDGWIAAGVLGAEPPNRADLQIAPTVRPADDDRRRATAHRGRPAARHALELFADVPGEVPAGVYPSDWLPAPAGRRAGVPSGA